jgi:hypothetical protein
MEISSSKYLIEQAIVAIFKWFSRGRRRLCGGDEAAISFAGGWYSRERIRKRSVE